MFEGVRDVLTLDASAISSSVGAPEIFTGTVAPDKTGHTIYLEQLGSDGSFHIVRAGVIHTGSTFELDLTFGAPGTETFRVVVPGGPANVSGTLSTVAIGVLLLPIARLPPAS